MKLLIFVFSVKGIRLRVDKGLGRVWGVGFVGVDGSCSVLL